MPTETLRMINMRKCVERLEALNKINTDMHRAYNLLKDVVEKLQIEPLTTSPTGLSHLNEQVLETLKQGWSDTNKARLMILNHTKGERELFDSYMGK